MASIDYAAKAAAAAKMLTKFGGEVTLREVKPGAYNPVTEEFEQEIVDTLCIGVKFNYQIDIIDGIQIQKTDQELYLATQGAPRPTLDHTVVIDGTSYTVIAVQVIEPYDVPILYILQIRHT